jgi:hypothetical protein
MRADDVKCVIPVEPSPRTIVPDPKIEVVYVPGKQLWNYCPFLDHSIVTRITPIFFIIFKYR